jgi:hypothetical protein
MDRLQEWEALAHLTGNEAELYDGSPAAEVARYALFGAVSAAPSGVPIALLMAANVQLGAGHAS